MVPRLQREPNMTLIIKNHWIVMRHGSHEPLNVNGNRQGQPKRVLVLRTKAAGTALCFAERGGSYPRNESAKV